MAGDFQRTSLAEIWRERNDDARKRIVARLAAERPDFVALVGDLVFHGSSALDWAQLDDLMTPLRQSATPVFPVLGNHEYWLSPRRGLGHFFARFPHLTGRRWYSVPYGPLVLIFLDSNASFLSRRAWVEQLGWYRAELARTDGDPEVAGVLVFLHHPPYTNSTVTGDERHVQRTFVPGFMKAEKTLAMIAGHVHSYERFCRSGKTFVVTGGGGGPRARLETGARRRHADDLFAGPPLRSLHFLLARLGGAGLDVEVSGLDESCHDFGMVDRFSLSFPGGERP